MQLADLSPEHLVLRENLSRRASGRPTLIQVNTRGDVPLLRL